MDGSLRLRPGEVLSFSAERSPFVKERIGLGEIQLQTSVLSATSSPYATDALFLSTTSHSRFLPL